MVTREKSSTYRIENIDTFDSPDVAYQFWSDGELLELKHRNLLG